MSRRGEDVGREAVDGEHMRKPVLGLDALRFAVADRSVVNDGVKDSKGVDLIGDRAHLLQAGEVAGDDGLGPRKPALRCFSALGAARMQDDGMALLDQQLCSHQAKSV